MATRSLREMVDAGAECEVARGRVAGEDRLFIKTGYDGKRLARGLPGALWHQASGCWHVPLTVGLVEPLRLMFTGGIKGDEHWAKLCAEAVLREEAQSSKNASALPDMPTTTEAWLHQRRAFHFAKDLPASALFVEMGGGKSAVAVGLCEHDKAMHVLIMCPKSVMGVWPKQFREHGIRDYEFWTNQGTGVVTRKAQSLATFLLRESKKPKVVVINYDVWWRDAISELLQGWKWDVEILDESHKIKSPGGKASRMAMKMNKKAQRIVLLTGTPQPHGPEDIYAQFRAADPRIFGTNFNQHCNRYFAKRKINDKIEVVAGFRDDRAREEFQQKMKSIAIVIKKEDMTGVAGEKWGLPAVERQVAFDDTGRNSPWRKYQEIKNELITEVEEGLVTADNILVKGLRLRQITSGFARTEDGIDSVVGNEKRQLLAEALDDLPTGEPVIVFGVFHHDLDVIADAAQASNKTYAELSGRRRDGLAADSTLAEGVDVLGCQLQSGGVGVDFTRACYAIYYSIDYNLGNVEQSLARLDRPGQTRPVTYIHLVVTTPTGGMTVDGVTYKALRERKALNEAVMDALRAGEL